MANNIERMKAGRTDLTSYVIHFTRGAYPFSTLKKIVTDGYLIGGWSFRGRRRTIFGKKPAVCFTETPLCGFLNYAAKRHNKEISSYGIFLQKKHLFDAGGRPVIYGTTLDPEEVVEGEDHFVEALVDSEQYRYILTTSIDGQNDWTHEREWRWANWQGYSQSDDMLPLWKIGQTEPFTNHNFQFWPIGIIVRWAFEAKQLQEILLQNYMLESEALSQQKEDDFLGKVQTLFSLDAIKRTAFIVLEDFTSAETAKFTIEEILTENRHIRMNAVLKEKGLVTM